MQIQIQKALVLRFPSLCLYPVSRMFAGISPGCLHREEFPKIGVVTLVLRGSSFSCACLGCGCAFRLPKRVGMIRGDRGARLSLLRYVGQMRAFGTSHRIVGSQR